MVKLLDELNILDELTMNAVVKGIKKAQRKNKIERIEESELETISKQLDNYNLLCVIPNRNLGIYQIFAENQEEFVFKVLTKDFKERKSESYSKRHWREEVKPYLWFLQSYLGFGYGYGKDIFLKRIRAKEDPNLMNRISSAKKFEGKILGMVDNGPSYKVITQTDEGYNIITLDSDSLEEKASEFYPTLTRKDKLKTIPYQVATGLVGLAIISIPFILLFSDVKKELVKALFLPTALVGGYICLTFPFMGRKEYQIKKIHMAEFDNELYKYARP